MSDYEISPIRIGGQRADGVWVNARGAWAGEVRDGEVIPLSDGQSFIPMRRGWRQRIVRVLKEDEYH